MTLRTVRLLPAGRLHEATWHHPWIRRSRIDRSRISPGCSWWGGGMSSQLAGQRPPFAVELLMRRPPP